MGDRLRHMVSVGEHDSTLKKSQLTSAFRTRNLSKKSATKVSVVKVKLILVTLGSTQSIYSGETTCLRESNRSTAPPGSSPLASSTGCNTWIASTDKGSVVEDSKAKEDDVDKDKDEEGRTRRGERGAEEEREEVGRDREDMTNLMKEPSSMRITSRAA